MPWKLIPPRLAEPRASLGMSIARVSAMTITNKLKSRFRNWLSCGLLGGAAACISSTARADDTAPGAASSHDRDSGDSDDDDDSSTHVAVDLDVGAAIDEPGTSTGAGGALRIGQELDLFLISLTPELGGSYHAFRGDDETRMYGGFVGGRLALGKVIEPAIFAHVGVAHVRGAESRTAPTLDGGLALDLTLLPLIDLGVHGGYNVMFPGRQDESLHFVTLGAHAALVL